VCTHAVAIVRVDELSPLGALHLAIAMGQTENLEEFRGAVCDLVLEIPLECRHSTRALGQPKQFFPASQRVCGFSMTKLDRFAFGDCRTEEQCRRGEHSCKGRDHGVDRA
jgi:hypothetical protein